MNAIDAAVPRYAFDVHPSGDSVEPHALTLLQSGRAVGGGKFKERHEAESAGDAWLRRHAVIVGMRT